MKTSAFLAVAVAAYSVSAQLDSIPPCALSCAISSLGSTGCQTTDIACICKATEFVEALVPCVQEACSAADFEGTVTAASALCLQAGVSLSVPVPTASATTSAPVSSTTEVSTTVVSTTEVSTTVVPPVVNSTTTETTPVPTNGTTTVTPPKPSGSDGSSASRNAVALGGLGALAAFVAALL